MILRPILSPKEATVRLVIEALNPDMKSLINFRDFGGLSTLDGRRVRSDRLYRCGQLSGVSETDLRGIIGLDFSVIADLRYLDEQQSHRSPWPEHYAVRIVSHGSYREAEAPHEALVREGRLNRQTVMEFYLELNRELPFDPLYRPVFSQAIQRLASDGGRILVHCAAGKDRTGVLAALILHCLGVPREAIVSEYLLSARQASLMALAGPLQASAKQRHGQVLSDDAVMMLLGVEATYIEAAFASIESQCGSVENYLAETGVDQRMIERLKHDLLSG